MADGSRIMLVNVEGREDDVEQFRQVAVDPWYDPDLRDLNWGDGRVAKGVKYLDGQGTDLLSFRVTVPVGVGNPAKAFSSMLPWFEDLTISYWLVDTRDPTVAECAVYEGGKRTVLETNEISAARFETIAGRTPTTAAAEKADQTAETDHVEEAIEEATEAPNRQDFDIGGLPIEVEVSAEEWAAEAAADALAAFEYARLPRPVAWLPYRKPQQLSFVELLEAA